MLKKKHKETPKPNPRCPYLDGSLLMKAAHEMEEYCQEIANQDAWCAGFVRGWNAQAEIKGRTCNLIEDGDLAHCSNCGGAVEKRLWAYWHYCPSCGAKVIDDD